MINETQKSKEAIRQALIDAGFTEFRITRKNELVIRQRTYFVKAGVTVEGVINKVASALGRTSITVLNEKHHNDPRGAWFEITFALS